MSHVTMEQIARKAGISRTTVSKVLNNRPIIVSKKTRDRIHTIVHQLGYRPNYFAKSLKEGRTRCIGLMGSMAIPNFEYPYVSNLTAVIEKGLVRCSTEFSLNIFGTGYTETYEKSLELIQKGLVEGLLIILATQDLERFEKECKPLLDQCHTPYVVMHSVSNKLPFNNVGVDSYQGGYLAGQHLCALGYKDIGYYDIYRHAPHYQEIFRGFKQALADNSVSFDPVKVIKHQFYKGELDNYGAAYKTILNVSRIPRALFIPSDITAIGAIRALAHKGTAIPQQTAIVAYNEANPNIIYKDELTSVYHPVAEKAKAAVRMLLGILDGKKSRNKVYNKTVKPWLEVRETCGGKV